ncbi:MAG: hypothetical protein WCI77_00180 [Candidatus Omnitrophota bacterium]
MIAKKLSCKNFLSFGRIITYPNKHAQARKKNLFRIVCKEYGAVGWRIAYLVVRDRAITRLEQHQCTLESFEPVKGRTLLYVAKKKDPRHIECFYLDKPIVLCKGVWHGVVTLDAESEVKITENATVKSAYWQLGFSLNSNHKKSVS